MGDQIIERGIKREKSEPRFGHTLRGQTAEEEFAYILRLIRRSWFYKEHGYKVVLPDLKAFRGLDDQSLPLVDKHRLFAIFQSQEYDPHFFDASIAQLLPKLALIESMTSGPFDIWHKSWGYIVFPTYQILLTKYGTGGSFDGDKGSITMRVAGDGSFPFPFPVENNILHEEVHLGVEGRIVRPLRLSHLEREVLVNKMCAVQFGGSIFDYSGRTGDYTHLGIYHAVNSESLLHLPNAIAEWAETRIK